MGKLPTPHFSPPLGIGLQSAYSALSGLSCQGRLQTQGVALGFPSVPFQGSGVRRLAVVRNAGYGVVEAPGADGA
jgi:hypothetical protein